MGLTLLFDIDGTLLRTRGAGFAAMAKVARKQFDLQGDLKHVPVHGRTDAGIMHDLFEVNGFENSPTQRQAFMENYLQELPDALTESEGFLLPGVSELLGWLHEDHRIRLGILTGNVEQAAQHKLVHFGIDHFFSFGGYGDVHADRNLVAEQALTAAIREGHLETDGLYVIGDTPNDVRCARHIQAKVIAVLTGGLSREELESAEADCLLDDLSDHQQFLDAVQDPLNDASPSSP